MTTNDTMAQKIYLMSYYGEKGYEGGVRKFPRFDEIMEQLVAIRQGKVDRIDLDRENELQLFLVGKPNCYYVVIFENKDVQCIIDNGSEDETRVELAGEYWPICETFSDFDLLINIVKEFYETGKPYKDAPWRF